MRGKHRIWETDSRKPFHTHVRIDIFQNALGEKNQSHREPYKNRATHSKQSFSNVHLKPQCRNYAALCSPWRKLSIRCSEVRKVNARMLIVVVLSVQFRKTLASQTYKLGTSWVCPKRFVTNFFGSFPMRQVPVSCRPQPGTSDRRPSLPGRHPRRAAPLRILPWSVPTFSEHSH